jgi:hypothetical protein
MVFQINKKHLRYSQVNRLFHYFVFFISKRFKKVIENYEKKLYKVRKKTRREII